MDSKELGFLFRVAICCALDSTKTVYMDKPDTVSQDIISTILALDLISFNSSLSMYAIKTSLTYIYYRYDPNFLYFS